MYMCVCVNLHINTCKNTHTPTQSIAMDWYSWLSKTGLDPSLVYEYGLRFSNNELEKQDISHFNHEFLQNMGISIAKHRLEILKLATIQKDTYNPNHHLSKILIKIKRTKRRFSEYLRALIRREGSGLAIVARPSYSARGKINQAMVMRNKKLMMAKSNNYRRRGAPLLLTNGSPSTLSSPRISCFSSPFECRDQKIEGDDQYWPCAAEEIRWDSMFQNLKPT